MANLTISWSSLKRYENCPQHALRSKQGLSHGVKDGRIFLPGTIADRAMRRWLESDDPQPGGMAESIPGIFREYAFPATPEERTEAQYVIRWKGDKREDQQKVIDFATSVVEGLEPVLVKEVLPHDYHPELKFRATIGIPYLDGRLVGVDLIGGIDVATRLKVDGEPTGRYKLFDLKATANPSYIQSTLGQGIFYDIAFGHWIGDKAQPERFGFIAPMLKTPDGVFWADITDDDRRAMLSRIIKACHGMWRKDWDPKADNSGCNYCDAKHVCDKFKVESQVDAQGRNRASFGMSAASRRTLQQRTEKEVADAGSTAGPAVAEAGDGVGAASQG